MALRLGYAHDISADLVNHFFLDLLEKGVECKDIRNPQAYLSIAFRRKLINHYHKSQKQKYAEALSVNEDSTIPSIASEIELIESNDELIQKLRSAFKRLPARCRRVMYQKFYLGLTTEQIVAKTGLSSRSVYNNISEGIKLLRREMGRQVPGVHIAALLSIALF
ncbi:MAG: sigma-70 family RNA polymerase sigma factor [Chitinophagaceae bacterium]|nr:sigma-70 family RNA polymerase sigma factor [Chitinophagaceae bacterium]